jgi:hypothetical protein
MSTKKFILTLCCPDDYEKTGTDGPSEEKFGTGRLRDLILPVRLVVYRSLVSFDLAKTIARRCGYIRCLDA